MSVDTVRTAGIRRSGAPARRTDVSAASRSRTGGQSPACEEPARRAPPDEHGCVVTPSAHRPAHRPQGEQVTGAPRGPRSHPGRKLAVPPHGEPGDGLGSGPQAEDQHRQRENSSRAVWPASWRVQQYARSWAPARVVQRAPAVLRQATRRQRPQPGRHAEEAAPAARARPGQHRPRHPVACRRR